MEGCGRGRLNHSDDEDRGDSATADPGPRAEEVIAEVYRQIRLIRESGGKPRKAVMPAALWNRVEEYRRMLGPMEGPVPDYLSEEGLFGLEIWYGDDPDIRVE